MLQSVGSVRKLGTKHGRKNMIRTVHAHKHVNCTASRNTIWCSYKCYTYRWKTSSSSIKQC